MKLLLISHQYTTWDITDLPLNQWYEIESEAIEYDKDNLPKLLYNIKTPYGSIGWIPKENFLTKDELREQNLKSLLNT